MKTHVFVSAAVVIMAFAVSGAMAEWGPSVPVTELNTQYYDDGPFLSYDGLTLYFARGNTGTFYYHRMYKATRPTASGPFTQVSESVPSTIPAAMYCTPGYRRIIYGCIICELNRANGSYL